MTTIELSISLNRHVSLQERAFRVIISHLIENGKINLMYREHTFAKYLNNLGEDKNSKFFEYFLMRRKDYMKKIEDFVLSELHQI